MNISPLNSFSQQNKKNFNSTPSFGIGFHSSVKNFYKQVRPELPLEQRKTVKEVLMHLRQNKILPNWIIGTVEDKHGLHITALKKGSEHLTDKPVSIWHLTEPSASASEKVHELLTCLKDDLDFFTRKINTTFEVLQNKFDFKKAREQALKEQQELQNEFFKKHPHLKDIIL